MTREKRVDATNRLGDLRSELDEVRSEAREAGRESDKADDLEKEFKQLKKQIRDFESFLEDCEDGLFTIEDLDFGQTMRVKDEVQGASFDADMQTGQVDGIPKEGFYKIVVLREAITQSPANTPDDPADYEFHVADWLYREIDELNTAKGVSTEDLWQEEESA